MFSSKSVASPMARVLRRALMGAWGVGLMGLSAGAAAQAYSVLDLGTLGGNQSYATGINASGQVVGYSTTADYKSYAFITGPNGSGMTALGTLGGFASYATGINASGQVVGYYSNAGGDDHAFITGPNGSGMTDLGAFGGIRSAAYGVNANGQVVGNYTTDGDKTRAFLTGPNGSGMIDLGTLGGSRSGATGINDSGQVVGSYQTNNYQTFAFITGPNGSGITALGSGTSDWGKLGELGSWASGINASGQVAGSALLAYNDYLFLRPFITGGNGSGMTALETGIGGLIDKAYGINALGQVVGELYADFGVAFITGPNGAGILNVNTFASLSSGAHFYDAKGINDAGQFIANATDGHAYLFSPVNPVPEPSEYALMLAGLGTVGWMARRRKMPSACPQN